MRMLAVCFCVPWVGCCRVDLQLMTSHVVCALAATDPVVTDLVAAGCLRVLSNNLKLGMKSSKKLSLAMYVMIWR